MFFNKFDIEFISVQELMSRDFILKFETSDKAIEAFEKIKNIKTSNDIKLFGDLSLNNNNLFLSLVINKEINDKDIISSFKNEKIKLSLL